MINPNAPDFANTPASPLRPQYSYLPIDHTLPPAVSIITPFFNIDPHLFNETAQSVLRQSFQQWEWLIVNDGSTQPAALAGLNAWRGYDPRIHLIEHSHRRGPAAARNSGFTAVRAEVVVMLDGDDLLEPAALEKWYWYLVSHPGCAFTQGYSVRFGAAPHLWARSFDQRQLFLVKNQTDVTSMVRRSVWQKAGGFNEALRAGLEDWDFWLACAACDDWGAPVPEYLNWYRLRPQHESRWPAWDNQARMVALRDTLRQRYPRLFAGDFPAPASGGSAPNNEFGGLNLLAKPLGLTRRLVLAASLADADLPAVLSQAAAPGVELSVCGVYADAGPGLAACARFTPDVFSFANFLPASYMPQFLLYLINSRQIDRIVVVKDGAESHGPPPVTLEGVTQLVQQLTGNALSVPPAGGYSAIDCLGQLSGEELAWFIPWRKLLKIGIFKLTNLPGLRWLYRFKKFGERYLVD